ncbi:sister chromatid cohesion 1 protein 4 isoform X2 [Neltuma alba]|uniref:sister chromatid cohesion 1 protein 4 isoform X2 n=1 Tax=Neltuma alba TaxID=207710 RepID=UPI0010A516A5|nr:sister chromatid cohesion 1 protein 4 isoform X2 [Prosopis alba]
MFYSQFILAKKGPLGTIWIAAHLERKLRKNQVADTDIGVSVDSILFPEVPIALRLSSHLLLGVVRIYSRKVNYLFDDCSEALLKIKQAFRSTAVDLPPEESTAPYHSITLPETFDLDDFELPDNDIFQGNYVDHHVSTREQITLQDTLEGAVYTTSQFGLDERFGDGDASQIGLDLEEDLLLEKASTFEHDGILETNPQETIQSDRPLDENERKAEETEALDGAQVKVNGSKIDGASSGIEASEYAQGPSTPGLEEPNLAPVINEVDYHNSTDFVSMKSTQEVSTMQDEAAIDHSVQDNVKNGNVLDFHHEKTDCLLGDCERENCPSLVPEYRDRTFGASAVPEKVEDLHDGVVINNEPVVSSLDQTVIDAVSRGINVSETVASPSCSHITSDQEDPSCKLLSHLVVSKGSELDSHLKDKHVLSKHETLTDIEIANSEGESAPFGEAKASSAVHILGSPEGPEVVDVESQASQELKEADASNHVAHGAVQPDELHLRPCTSHLGQTDVLSIGGDCQEEKEQSVCKEIHQDQEKSEEQHESQIFIDNQVTSDSKSVASDLPAPEKMLSLSYQHSVGPNDVLMESTPDNRDMAGGFKSVEGVKCVSGKKRCFTESTLTMQSVDLSESYGGTQSKRSAEFLPDDDDLLSSILVGRRSSFLKVKPTPAASEVVSIKRPRLVPRTSALKRKVLTDDTMVLHGDIIRQQLTNTEDIRRMRKKAPCTHREILMIQRQFLEDEIFQEPALKGVSAGLSLLRNEKLDLARIKVCDHTLDSSLSEATNDNGPYLRTNVTEIHGVERNIEPVMAQDVEEQPAGTAVVPENNQSEFNAESLHINVHGNSDVISRVKEIQISQTPKMNGSRENIEVFDSENCSTAPGFESSSHADSVFDNNNCMPDDFAAPLAVMDKSNDFDGSMHTDTLGISSSQNLHPLPILEDELVESKINRSGVGTSEISEDRVDIGTEVQIDGSETVNNLYPSLATECERTDEYTYNQASLNRDLHAEDSGNNLLGSTNEDQILASGSGYDDKDSRFGCSYNENTTVGYLHGVADVLDANEASLFDQENSVSHEADQRSTMHPEISAIESPLVDQNDENIIVTEDTGFLNVDDDMVQDDDDYIPCDEGAHLENSGWSSRSRAVAKYLQVLFDKEDVHGRKNLPLDNLIAGKTRKEASRMFFETLVLKTRDYVHVEQTKPFANINIKPRSKLMKSDF